MVKPAEKRALQMYHHCAGHWIVASAAKVAREIGKMQSGANFGEDNIVRYEDLYQQN